MADTKEQFYSDLSIAKQTELEVAESQNNYLSKREVYIIKTVTNIKNYRLKITTSQRERFINITIITVGRDS